MSFQINEKLLQELIRLALKYKETSGFGTKSTEIGIQKTLYELKRKLPETNPIKEQLAFYWFKAGAYSEFITKELHVMISIGALEKEERKNYSLFALKQDFSDRRLIEHDEKLQEARKILQDIVSNLQPFSIYNEIKSQYEDDAPSMFYPRFKLEFLPNIGGYYKSITKVEGKNQYQRECLSKLLNIATSSLPMKSLFSDFKKIYFDYETSVYRILRWKKNDKDQEFQDLIQQSRDLAEEVWNTFAYGARIMKHDPPYEERVEDWKKMLNERVVELSSKINEFYLQTLEKTKSNDFDEQIISLDKFTSMILDYRKNKEITFINFQAIPDISQITEINQEIKQIPEFSTFLNEGQLDWKIIKELSDNDLKNILSKCIGSQPIYVAYSDNGPKTVTYRIELNSLSSVEEIELQN